MKHRSSFGYFKILPGNVLEITVDQGKEITLEMLDESNDFISAHFTEGFGLLINRINQYTYSYEAQLSVASHSGLRALAFVCYSSESEREVRKMQELRAVDQWNVQFFSGLELGWQQAYNWLKEELAHIKIT